MIVPNYVFIAEILLFSYSFINPHNLKKITSFKLCSEHRSIFFLLFAFLLLFLSFPSLKFPIGDVHIRACCMLLLYRRIYIETKLLYGYFVRAKETSRAIYQKKYISPIKDK